MAKYFKLGKDKNMFYDPSSKLKVMKGVPGTFKGVITSKTNRLIREAISGGHIVEITKDEYDQLLADHDSRVKESNRQTHLALKKKKALQKGQEIKEEELEEEEVEELEEEEVEEEDDEEEDDDDEEEVTAKDMVEFLANCEDIPEEEKLSKNKLRKLSESQLTEMYNKYHKG